MKENYTNNGRCLPLRHTWLGLVAVLLLLLTGRAAAQSYNMPATGTTTITTCSGTLYDNGGPTGSYPANSTGTITIMPATAGNKVKLQFSTYSVGYYDRLSIYDGSSTSAPLIGTYSDYQSPGTVYATTSTGTLTLRFATDYYTSGYNGFAADISCVTTVPQADLTIQGASVTPISAVPGTSLSLYSSIYNLSGTTATSSTIGYYLSTDATLDATDVLLGSSVGSSLQVGSYSSRNSYVTLPATTTSGAYYVLFAADYQNAVSESNETNNVSSVYLNVVPPTVDLIIQQPAVSPSNTAPGNVLNLSCGILNQGNATASNSSVGFYLSTNTTLDASDQLLTSAYGSALTPGYPAYRGVTTNVPPGTAPGTYYILFAADYQDLVTESNETNNVASVALTVAAPNVDLIVSQAGLSTYTVSAGTSVMANAYLYNQGNTTAPTSTTGYYFSSDATLSANDVLLNSTTSGTLAAGQGTYPSAPVTIPATATPGTYYILFVADHLNTVTESNETNNVRSLSLSVVAPSIDLVIQSPYLGTSTSVAGATLNASFYIYNQGNTTSPSSNSGCYLSTDNTFSANDVLLASNTGGALAPGNYGSRYSSLTIPASTAAGNYYVLFVADDQSQVAETNEQNNVSSLMLTLVAPGIDLLIAQQGISRTSAAAGSGLSAGAYIYNQGTTSASSSTVGYYLSTDNALSANDVLLGASTGSILYAGGSDYRNATLTIPTATTAGNYYVLFVADHLGQVTETNEQNNVASAALTVTAPFNGTIVPYSGSATITTCSTTIADNGGADDYANSSNGTLVINPSTAGNKIRLTFTSLVVETCCDAVSVYDGPTTSATLLGTFTSLPTGPITASAQNTSGALTVVFTSDPIVAAPGFLATVSCITLGPPDLIVQTPTASLSTVASGGIINLGATVRNQGSGDAGSSQLGYYLSTNTTLDASDVSLGTTSGGLLGAGLSAQRGGNFTIPAATTAGSYYVLYVVDPQNSVTESNETNNTASLALTVTISAPDLVLTQPTLTPASVAAGNSVSATCLLSNQGSASAAASLVGFYLSTDNVLSANDVLLGTTAAPAMGVFGALTRSAAVTIPATTTPGSYFMLYVADQQGTITETDETNNVISRALTVTTGTATQDQLNGLTLSVYPNPATRGQFEVRLDGSATGKAASLLLYNSLGQLVTQQVLPLTAGHGPARFATKELPAGVYLLRIAGDNLSATRRVVIE
ncbi:Por secretion system C-terminal sorting domain-containing protein [Hymenobacter daecheongensis DSM 21074]|uniref:Por secretion system C-terminal sorting domain-containing protein n=1 Tax=Hymenobacter daecheongensis DSM 21074 TaxID=1121955 RepID=A0A1M6D9P7_9BACT|nr:CARDB domain-containing protein [Hymenobacter daecheongensis]SHI69889.1 Por secretion system C-terminal sorting domain-containing protein [Hymenobacter daecheongensis DSM 21074]